MRNWLNHVLLYTFVAGAVAVPLSRREQCARHCTESSRFQLTPGTTYTYDYETTSTTTAKGTSQDKTQLHMVAQVDVEVLSKCDLSLRLRGVTLKQSDPQSPDHLNPIKGGREFARSVERHVLRFSYQDGRIEDLCPAEGTPSWITNIHRGVLSVFQNSMRSLETNERVMETDVSGKCSAEYQSLGKSWRGILTIRKVKDLNTCTDRHNVDTSLQSTPYTHAALPVQQLPIISGTQECEQTIGDGMLQTSSCTEMHIFRPFSNKAGGVTTSVTQKLTFSTTSKRTFTGNDYRPTRENLLFDHDEEPSSEDNVREAESAMRELCDSSRDDIRPKVPRKFTSFVYRLRKLSKEELDSFNRRVTELCPDNPKARKFFFDAIPMIATSSSVNFMVDLISKKEVPKSEANFWYTSLSFISDPTADMISALTPLIDGTHDQAFLGISALARTFCTKNDCSNSIEVRTLVHRLADLLGENCYNSDVRKILLSLKSLGNIGFPYGRERILERCYKNPQLTMEVRLAAIQVFRRFSCDVSNEELMKTYTNPVEDSEIRIASYLAIMRCPTPDTIQIVRETLKNEKINQVGSFVWTHLRALAKSKHPERQDIKDVLSSIYLLNKYQSDIRKFSSAREASILLESLDSRIHVDTHFVFPTHSYLPHSATLNLTVDIFGHSCNLLQLDGRLEGLESAMERFFGPSGYFPQKNIATLLRDRRSVSDNKIDQMDRDFDVKSTFAEKPYGSLDMKIFGNTLWYKQFQESEDTDFDLMNLVTELAKEQEKEYSRSFMFLDSTYTIPMASGLPLRLAVNGTTSIGLKIGGKLNVRSFQHVDVLGHIEPSGAVEMAGLLTVDAGTKVRSGIRVSATLHTSTVLDGKMEVTEGRIVKAQLNVPREKMEIINIQSRLYLVHGSEEKEQSGVREKSFQQSYCSEKVTGRVFGMEICSDIQLPRGKPHSPMYPLNGPAVVSVFLRKTDPALKSYTFDAQWDTKMVKGQLIYRGLISLNTPNSNVDRDVSAELQLSELDRNFILKLKTPMKKVGINAQFVNDPALKKIDLRVTADEEEKLSIQSELRRESGKKGVNYATALEVRTLSGRLASVVGSANLKYGHKYSGHLSIYDLTAKPILLKGSLDHKDQNRYEGELNINSWALDANLNGQTQIGDTSIAKFNTDYSLFQGRPNRISISSKIRNLSANALTKYTGVLSMQATALPEWDTSLSWETMSTAGHLENTVSLSLGDGQRSRIHTINMQEIIKYKGDLKNNEVSAILKLNYPEKNINYGFEMKHENTPKTLKNIMGIQYAPNKQIRTYVDLSVGASETSIFSGDAKIEYPGREARLNAELNKDKSANYRAGLNVQWQTGEVLTVVAHYNDKSRGPQLKYEVVTEVTYSNKRVIAFSGSIGANNGQYAGLAEFVLNREKYRLNADYQNGPGFNHRISSQLLLPYGVYATEAVMQSVKDKFTTAVELKIPSGRRIVIKADMKNSKPFKAASMECKWDADRDPSKTVGMEGEIRSKTFGYESKFLMQVMKRVMKGSLSTSKEGHLASGMFKGTHKAEFEWSPTSKVTFFVTTNIVAEQDRRQFFSTMEITTPYKGYESMGFDVKHLKSKQQWNSEITTTWSKNRRLFFSSEGKYSFINARNVFLNTNFNIQTPFYQMRTLILNITHRHDTSMVSNKVDVIWNSNKALKSNIFGKLENSDFNCNVAFTSPFNGLENIAAEVTHSYSSETVKTKGEVQWAVGRRIEAILDGKHLLSGKRRMCSVNLVVNSPYKGYERVSSKFLYNSDSSAVNADIETYVNKQKTTMGFTGFKRNSPNINMEGKMYFTSSLPGYNKLDITTSLESRTGFYKLNINANLPFEKIVSLNSHGKLTSYQDVELNFVLNEDYNYFRHASFDFTHKFQDSNLRTTLVTAYGDKRFSALLTGMSSTGYRSQNLEGTLSLNTPITNYEEVKIEASYTKQNLDFTSKIKIHKNRENFVLGTNLKIKDSLNFEFNAEATSTYSSFREFKTSISQTYAPAQFIHNANIYWNQQQPCVFSVIYQDKDTSKELVTKFSSPFKSVKDVQIYGWYQNKKGVINPKITFKLNKDKQVSIEGNLKNYNRLQTDANVLITSNFPGYEYYYYSGQYDIRSSKKTLDTYFSSGQKNNKIVSLTTNGLFEKLASKIDLTLATPLQGIRRINFIGEYDIRSTDKSVSLAYNREQRRVTLNANSKSGQGRGEYQLSFTSPFNKIEDIRAMLKYEKNGHSFSGEVSTQWAEEKQVKLAGEVNRNSPNAEGNVKITMTTPFEGYRNMIAETFVDTTSSEKVARASLAWDRGQMELTATCKVLKHKEGRFTVEFRSPFKNFREIKASSNYKLGNRAYEGEMRIEAEGAEIYQSSVKYTPDYHFISKVNTPYSPFRNAEFSGKLTTYAGHQEVNAKLKWEDKETSVYMLYENNDRDLTLNLNINTPFESFQELNIENSMRTTSKSVDAYSKISTPFEILRKLHVTAKFERGNGIYKGMVTGWTSAKSISVTGEVMNSEGEPIEATINVNSPSRSFDAITVTTRLNNKGIEDNKFEFIITVNQDEHSLETSIKNIEGIFQYALKMKSSLLPSGSLVVDTKADYQNPSSNEAFLNIVAAGKSHSISGNFRKGRKNVVYELKLSCPYIRGETAEIKGSHTERRQFTNLYGDITFTIYNSEHQLQYKYENDKKKMFGEFVANSDFLPSSVLKSDATYINNNGKDVEFVLTVSTPNSKNSVTGSIKNYLEEKFFQVKIACPSIMECKELSVTGTLKHENWNAFDAILSVSSPHKELRIAGNLKRSRWDNVEAFLTLNTPYEPLRMLRIDGRFNNDKFKNIECNMKLETSNENLPTLGFTGKLSRSEGSEDLSLMLHLPSSKYSTVQLLGNTHYNADRTVADSRITLTFPPKRYSVYGQYMLQDTDASINAEFEWNSKKWTGFSNIQNRREFKGISTTVKTPEEESYTFGGSYTNSRNRRSVNMVYDDSRNQVVKVNASLDYISLASFETALTAILPFNEYRNLEFQLRHQRERNRLFLLNTEYSINHYKVFANLMRRIGSVSETGNIRLETPFRLLRQVVASYSTNNREKKETLEAAYNHRRIIKAEANGHKSSRTYSIDLPIVPLTISARSRQSSSGHELNIVSNYPTRTATFTSVYLNSAETVAHKAEFSWDERARMFIGYDVKLTDTSRGQSSSKEVLGRLTFPLRTLELKGKIEKSNRVHSAGADIYWDADGDREKHITFGVEHQDHGTRDKMAHKVQLTLFHPQLPKELVQTFSVSKGPNEFHGKSEFQYSRHPEHHLNLELKSTALGRDNFKGELSLKHPATYLDLKMFGEVTNNNEEATVHARINNVDRRRLLRVQELRGKISKLRQQIELMMRSDKDRLSLTGQMTYNSRDFILSVDQKLNDQYGIRSRLRLNKSQRTFEMNTTTTEDDGIYISAALPDESASLRLGHFSNNEVISDASVLIGLERSKILRSQINWKPSLWEDIRIATGEILRNTMRSARTNMNSMMTNLSEEKRYKMFHISQAINDHLTQFFNSISRDAVSLAEDIATAQNTLRNMYENNEFFAQDFVKGVMDVLRKCREFCDVIALITETLVNSTLEYIDELYYNLCYAWEDFVVAVQKFSSKLCAQACIVMNNIGARINNGWKYVSAAMSNCLEYICNSLARMKDAAVRRIESWLQSYAPFIIDTYYYAKATADRIREAISGTVERVTKSVTKHPLYIALNEYLDLVVATVETFRQMDILDTVQSRILTIGEAVRSFSNVNLLQTINNHVPLKYVSDIAKTTLQKSLQLYSALGMDDALKSIGKSILYYAQDWVISSSQELLQEFYHLRGGARYEFQPEKGNIYFEYTLPVSRKNLADIFDFGSYPEYQRLKEIKNTLITQYYEDFCVWDIYYSLKKYFSPGYWIPPFTGYAMVAGNQHYITFDKFAFDFAGECSYLLARDFVDGNFTVVANYGRDGQRITRKSLTVISETKKVNIGHDYKVTLDDVKIELPLQTGHTVITREGSVVRIENAHKGFVITCNFVYDICTMAVSGFYFGKTGGLFGTYDNEPSLDFLTPNRNLATDVVSFANSWEVSPVACRKSGNLATRPGNDYRVQEKCKALFERTTSDFRACFKQINPGAYLKMCISDLSAVHERDFDSSICTSAAAYYTECKTEGIPLKMPRSCIRCETQDKSMMTEGDVTKFTSSDPPRVADVVFVVEEKSCNSENFKMLGKLAYTIEDNFKEKGFRDIRYSVVGFGGDGVHAKPHVHTLDGQISGSVRSIESAFRNLEVGDGPVYILEALRYAASLPLRPGTSKSFVLVKCSACRSEEVRAEYSEMLRTLLDGDIGLHLLMEQKYEMKTANKNSKAKKVIGLDSKFAFTLKDIKDVHRMGDGDLLPQIKIPKDVCIPLALEVNGSTFDSQYLTETRKNTYKKFMDVLARRILKSAQHRAEWDMCCECIATVEGVGKSTCQRCVSSEVAAMISPDMLSIPRTKTENEDSKTKDRRHKKRKI